MAKKEKIMGFGHAVYSTEDPRNKVIKEWAKKLSVQDGNEMLYQVSEEIEKTMDEEKNMFANTDFFMASAYHYLGIPTSIFTPFLSLEELLAGLQMYLNKEQTIESFDLAKSTLALKALNGLILKTDKSNQV